MKCPYFRFNFLEHRPTKKKIIYLLIAICIINFFIITYHLYVRRNLIVIGKQCYQDIIFQIESNSVTVKESEDRLHDVLESAKLPTPGRSIFFHETSCSVDGTIKLNAR